MPSVPAKPVAVDYIGAPAQWYNGLVFPPSWANLIQTDVNSIIDGTVSLKGITVDATGAAVAAPTAGTITSTGVITSGGVVQGTQMKPTATAGGTSTPTASITPGNVYKDAVVFAWCRVEYSGGSGGSFTFRRGFNIASVVRNGVGQYNVNFQTAGSGSYLGATANVNASASVATCYADCSASVCSIFTTNATGTLADPTGTTIFDLIVVGA